MTAQALIYSVCRNGREIAGVVCVLIRKTGIFNHDLEAGGCKCTQLCSWGDEHKEIRVLNMYTDRCKLKQVNLCSALFDWSENK